jgi:hypothetical protein
MKKVKTRQLIETDIKLFGEWLYLNRELNRFDPDIFTYGSTRVIAVAEDDDPVMFVPYQIVILMESVAPNPRASPMKRALALKQFQAYLIDLAAASGIGEIYFVATDKDMESIAKRHGYEEVEGTLLRLKPHNFNPRKLRK